MVLLESPKVEPVFNSAGLQINASCRGPAEFALHGVATIPVLLQVSVYFLTFVYFLSCFPTGFPRRGRNAWS